MAEQDSKAVALRDRDPSAALVDSVFSIYPMAGSVWLSLFNQSGSGVETFVGLQNYVTLFTNDLWAPQFWNAFIHNIYFFLIHFFVQNPIGLLLASLLTAATLRFRGAFRTIYFLPTLLSFVIVGFIWQLILSPIWGVAKGFLDILGLSFLFQPWLGKPETALTALGLISVWQFVGIPMLLFYAALISIPEELVEAARVDGASSWIAFWRIKFPLILPTVGVVSILTFVGNFNAFDLIYTTQGALAGPNFATDIFGTFFYRTFFGFQLQLGNPTMGATIATMMFLIILSGVLVYLFFWQRRITTYEL